MKLTPAYYEYGRPVYTTRFIERTVVKHLVHGLLLGHIDECPNCGAVLERIPSHDVSVDGMMLTAVPDQWECRDCDYSWQE